MRELLMQNPIMSIVFVAVVAVMGLFVVVKTMQTVGLEKVRAYVYWLFQRAEHEFQHGQNKEKFEYVVNLAKNAIPAPFNLFITESCLRKIIQTWFDLCKDFLDDGKMNGTGRGE